MQVIGTHLIQIVALLSVLAFSTPQDRDTQKIESLYGTVVEVTYLPASTPAAKIVEVRIKVSDKKLRVRLAPASFLNEYGFEQKPGDDIYVRGYRLYEADGELMVALEIGRENRKLTLRNDRGQPIW